MILEEFNLKYKYIYLYIYMNKLIKEEDVKVAYITEPDIEPKLHLLQGHKMNIIKN
jgi:hypothetical protein